MGGHGRKVATGSNDGACLDVVLELTPNPNFANATSAQAPSPSASVPACRSDLPRHRSTASCRLFSATCQLAAGLRLSARVRSGTATLEVRSASSANRLKGRRSERWPYEQQALGRIGWPDDTASTDNGWR